MKMRRAWYAVWADGTKWLGWEPSWVAECRRTMGRPNAAIVRMERVMILR